jgi:hypothetical protein
MRPSAAAAGAHDDRYLGACRIYRDEARPELRASDLIDNTDPERPRLLRISP